MHKDYGKLSYDVLKTIPFFMRTIMSGFHKTECCNNLNPTQKKTLMLLHHREKIAITELGKRMNMEKGSFSSVVESLLSNELIIKKQDNADKRKYLLELTEKGAETVSEIQEAFKIHIETLLKDFKDDEVNEISQALTTLYSTALTLQEKHIER